MLTLYGIPSCDACRNARKWLTDHGMEHRFHDLRADGLDTSMLERWSRALEWQDLLNRRSVTWRKVPEVDRASLDSNKAISLMLDQPTLVKRPVLETDDVVVVGFSPDTYQDLLG
ncbi:MAG: arsenate reductase [Woeseiaceae bacterium]|nr:arsenate reductase [Woeseiaceae bacterium]